MDYQFFNAVSNTDKIFIKIHAIIFSQSAKSTTKTKQQSFSSNFMSQISQVPVIFDRVKTLE